MKDKTSLRTLDEFYKTVNQLIERLKMENHLQEALKLDDLLHHTAWTTDSELLGELGLALNGMRGIYSREINLEIKECLTFAKDHSYIILTFASLIGLAATYYWWRSTDQTK